MSLAAPVSDHPPQTYDPEEIEMLKRAIELSLQKSPDTQVKRTSAKDIYYYVVLPCIIITVLYLFLTAVVVPDFVERVDSRMLELSRMKSTCWTMYLELSCSFRMLNMTKALDEICEEYSRCSVGIGLFVNRIGIVGTMIRQFFEGLELSFDDMSYSTIGKILIILGSLIIIRTIARVLSTLAFRHNGEQGSKNLIRN
ncbi:5773_t:CDS:2 [Paraglomus occultum]|uniref:5773_t:CDS:1 n=1 Tax=Paraglomus occultum TaxID=144539 RepID=A0A9N8YZG3_9GLOM|nr:5773_t:CDS:2 [Paraglomus occultum]